MYTLCIRLLIFSYWLSVFQMKIVSNFSHCVDDTKLDCFCRVLAEKWLQFIPDLIWCSTKKGQVNQNSFWRWFILGWWWGFNSKFLVKKYENFYLKNTSDCYSDEIYLWFFFTPQMILRKLEILLQRSSKQLIKLTLYRCGTKMFNLE